MALPDRHEVELHRSKTDSDAKVKIAMDSPTAVDNYRGHCHVILGLFIGSPPSIWGQSADMSPNRSKWGCPSFGAQ